MWAYIAFDIAVAIGVYYVFRVRKAAPEGQEEVELIDFGVKEGAQIPDTAVVSLTVQLSASKSRIKA
jgi:hypothetical protein